MNLRLALLPLVVLAATGCYRSPSLPVYGHVPQFTLTAQTGQQFDSRALNGRIWVADFFFSTCTGPCPRMGAQMRWVKNQVRDLPQVRFVSFTVDPERDTPAALATYAHRFGADPEHWYFLTGPQATLEQLDRYAFKLGDVDGHLMHSTRFVLVDQQGRIRGYYATDEQDGLRPLLADIRRLAREPS